MLAGDPALDFANSLHWRSGREVDFLPHYACLLDWCVPAGLLSESERDRLHQVAQDNPVAASAAHMEAIRLRGIWRACLSERVENAAEQPAYDDLDGALSDLLRSGSFVMALAESQANEAGLLGLPATRAALAIASLHLLPAGRQIGRCEGDPCGGFFLNTSRSKPRRWCSMDSCGNRAKVREYRSRFAAEAVE